MIKVTLRKRKTRNGNIYLYLEYYPAMFNPFTLKTIRYEALGIQLYSNPSTAREKKYNAAMMEKGEAERCRRQLQVVNEEFDIKNRYKQADFLDYFYKIALSKPEKWMAVYKHFHKFIGGKCTFGAMTVSLCDKFREYLVNERIGKHNRKLSTNSASGYFCIFRTLLKEAYRAKYLQENLNDFLDAIPCRPAHKEYLTIEEVRRLKDTPCTIPVLKRASMFAILTGLRISDILTLEWEHFSIAPDGGPCIVKNIEKSDRVELNYIGEEALSYCGEKGSGLVFRGLTRAMTYHYLPQWMATADIKKHVTFHTFRHTNATLLASAGIDIYTVSKMLNHRSVATTQIYADLVDEKKRKAANVIGSAL